MGLRREGAEQNPIFPPNYTSGADENEEMELHQTLISHETETSKQRNDGVGKQNSKEQEERAEEEREKNPEEDEVSKDLPGVQLTRKKRNAQSPIEETNGKRDRVGRFSDSSSSGDLNRLFPLGSPNEISFLSIELQTSTPKVSSRGKQVQSPDSPYIERREELV